MIRRFLRTPADPFRNDAGGLYADESLLREAALALAAYATADGAGRNVGDPVFERVTEGRRSANERAIAAGIKQVGYSSCGDLAHWMLRCLGCRDESLVNRSDDGGERPWTFQGKRNNISILDGSPLVMRAVKHKGEAPKPGDVLFLMNKNGGHIAILRRLDLANWTATTEDLGQPYARRRTRTVKTQGGLHFDGCPLVWWLPLDRVPLSQSAILPDGCELGVEDDNPYPEADVPLA